MLKTLANLNINKNIRTSLILNSKRFLSFHNLRNNLNSKKIILNTPNLANYVFKEFYLKRGILFHTFSFFNFQIKLKKSIS